MAYLDPRESSDHLRDQTLEALKTHFPIKGSTHTVELASLSVGEGLDPDDIREQHKMKVEGGNFAVPVHGHLRLIENSTGNVVDEKKLRLVDLPQMTSRYSYIVGGKEYQVSNQWQLKPGAYTHRGKDGQLKTQFNVVNKSPLALTLHPESGGVKMEYRSAELPVYPMLRALGVTDTEVEKRLGKDFLAANKGTRGENAAIAQFYKSSTKKDAPDEHTALKHFVDQMADSKLDPTATKHTLGAAVDHVSGDALLRAIERLHKVHNGAPEDDKDSLVFKNLRSTGDYAADKIREHGKAVRSRVGRQINASTKLRQIIPPGLFNAPIRDTFTDNAASELAAQINPVEMLGKNSQTTVLGPGGISSEQQILDSVKLINQSHMAFQDTVVTPESSRTGVNLRLPMGLKKVGVEAKVHLHNVRTGKTELVDAAKFLTSNVVLPDQVEWKNGKPVPLGDSVRVAGDGNHFKDVPFSKADYVLRHSSQLFSSTTNLIPFLGSVSGNRASMATRHIEQAISLVDREPPLVQAATGSDVHGIHTFDEVLGKHAAHVSPVHGTVTSIQPDGIHISTGSGSKEVQLYNNFPLNDAKSVLHSTPIVKVGDKVTKGQVLADTNYSKNGVLALGRNLRTAYLDFKGLNYEDGLVISETAAKKLSSHHMYKDTVQLSPETILDRKKFLEKLPGLYNVKTQVGHLGEDGVALVGSRVKPGDPLILAMKPYDLKSRTNDKAYQKALLGTHTDNSLRWHGEVEGEVVSVHRQDGAVHVHVRTVEPAKVGDKASARSANKGVISAILPDKDMPHSRDGAPLEILMSPLGVPGRMNPSQILETAAGKIAMKTGKPYIVPNFKPGLDAVSHVQAELKKHGLSDTEELVDPVSGHSLGQVMTGYQHVLKLVHQSDKKLSVTSGMGLPGVQGGDTYDNNLQPKSGQRLGSLGTYAMLAHGSVHNLREFQALKGEGADSETDERKRWNSAHLDIWNAIQTGSPIPTPKKSFAFHKFEEMLRGSGINVEKKGHEVFVTPLTDKHVLELAGSRVITKPGELLNARVDKHSGEMVPKAGGLFDPTLTGGHNGKRWSRFPLAEPMPNPIFEGPIKSLTGLSGAQFDGLLGGTHSVTSDGKVVAGIAGPHRGGHAIEHLLKKIDVSKELEAAKAKLSAASPSKVDECLKRVKYLNTLAVTGTTADEAYVMKNIAVIPPALRPASILNDGKNIDYADINELYKSAGIVNTKLSDPQLRHAPEEQSKLRVDLYKRIAGISGYGIPFADAKHKGLLHTIAGAQPKGGMFQKRITQKRQDLSMAAVVIPEPNLGLNEVGFPREAALDLFRPFVVRKLQEMGHASNPLEAQKVLALRGPASFAALQKVVEERPTLLKRDPSLHKYSIQGFDVKLTTGNAIKLHPLVCGGFTADFDGDVMRAYVPISKDAISEVHRMKPTNNLFSEASNRLMYVPTLGSALGIYKTSLPGKDTGKEFSSHGHVVAAARDKSITVNDIVTVDGKKTTAGRVLLSMTLPQALQGDVLHDIHKPLDAKALDALLTRLGKDHHADFDKSVNMIKDVGYHASFGVIPVPGMPQGKEVYIPVGAHSLSLKDLQTHSSVRDSLLASAHSDVAKIRKTDGHSAAADAKVVDRYQTAETAMKASVVHVDPLHGSNLHTMFKAGVKPGWDQYKQLVFAPMLLKDSTGRTIPTPVTRSYSEGLDVSGYWTQMHGARSGSVQKVQAVQDPGYLSKLLMQSSVDTLVSSHDCGTKRGVLLSVADDDVHDRVLAADYHTDKLSLPAGTMLNPRTVGQIRAADHTAKLLVRSPMRCEHGEGICQKCAGLSSSGQPHPIGANIGVHAAQAVGERAVQLMLKAFHCMHEHSLVLIRQGERVFHTTLGTVFRGLPKGGTVDGEETRLADDLEVWDKDGWVKIKSARRHIQQAGTAMVFTRARAGFGIVSQDNHPHMLTENTAVCGDCGTFPKRDNGGRQYYCRKCRRSWDGEPEIGTDFCMVEPSELGDKSHAALLSVGPTPTASTAPLANGWLAGIFCAEGCTQTQVKNDDYVVGVSISQNIGGPIHARIGQELVVQYGDVKLGAHRRGYQLYGRDRALFFQESFGRYSRDKGLRGGWSGLPRQWLLDFVSGVFDGDGTFVNNNDSAWKTCRIDTTSLLLAQQVHWILRSAGIPSRVVLTPKRKLTRHQGYAVSFVATAAVKSALSSSVKLRDIDAKPLANDERFPAVVDYIRPVYFASPPYVYDLETETGTLFVNGFWTHNTGGVAVVGGGSKTLGAFDRLNQLTGLPENIPYSATLAMKAGKVEEIKHTPTGVHVVVAGKSHFVGKDPAGHPLHEPHGPSDWSGLKVGQHVAAGDHLSDPHRTVVNPHHLYEATGSMERVQNHLADEVFKLYKGEGILRKHVEVVVRNMSNLTKVVEPGDASGILRGEFKPASSVHALNKQLLAAGRQPVEHTPVLRGVSTMPQAIQEDWMAKLQHMGLRNTLVNAAAEGAVSHLHGAHPIPGLAYGAEFGLNKAHSNLPGRRHLADVKEHHY